MPTGVLCTPYFLENLIFRKVFVFCCSLLCQFWGHTSCYEYVENLSPCRWPCLNCCYFGHILSHLDKINMTCKVSFVGTSHSPSPSTCSLTIKVVGRAPKLVAICIYIRMSAVWNLCMDLFVSGTLFMISSFKVWYGKPLKLLLKSF